MILLCILFLLRVANVHNEGTKDMDGIFITYISGCILMAQTILFMQ